MNLNGFRSFYLLSIKMSFLLDVEHALELLLLKHLLPIHVPGAILSWIDVRFESLSGFA